MRNVILSMLLFLTSTVALSSPAELNPKRTIVIAGPITGRIVGPVSEALDKLAKNKDQPVDVVIASPGGSVVAGYFIVDKIEALRASGVKFRCVVRSVAASMAFQLLLHCDERYSTPHAFLLWHPVRVFYQGALTADLSKVAHIQMKMSDDMIRQELYDNLPMSRAEIDWHFSNETLHHASQLHKQAPGFFTAVSSGIKGTFNDDDVLLNTANIGGLFLDETSIQYIHEQFIHKEPRR